MKFREQYTNELRLKQLFAELEDAEQQVRRGLTALKNEGLPTNEDFIKKITSSPDAFRDYIRDLAKEKTETGFMPIDEKSRIVSDYNGILNRINIDVQAMRENISKVVLKPKGNTVAIDIVAAKEKAKQACTYTVDVQAMEAYFNEVIKLQKSLEKFRTYEKEHSLQSFETGIWKNFAKCNFAYFCDHGSTPELFEDLFSETFKV